MTRGPGDLIGRRRSMTLAHDSRRRIRMWNKLGSHGEWGGVGGGAVTSNYVFLPFLPLFLLFCLSLSLRLSRSPDENSTNQLRINGDSDNTTSNSPFNTTTGQQEGPTQRCCTLTLHWSLCMWTQEEKKRILFCSHLTQTCTSCFVSIVVLFFLIKDTTQGGSFHLELHTKLYTRC